LAQGDPRLGDPLTVHQRLKPGERLLGATLGGSVGVLDRLGEIALRAGDGIFAREHPHLQ
jgi:hypothetical protein